MNPDAGSRTRTRTMETEGHEPGCGIEDEGNLDNNGEKLERRGYPEPLRFVIIPHLNSLLPGYTRFVVLILKTVP